MNKPTRLRALREARGETVSGMAKRLKIGVSRYHMIESGERPATPDIAKSISEILQVQKEFLFLPQSFTVRKDDEMAAAAEIADEG